MVTEMVSPVLELSLSYSATTQPGILSSDSGPPVLKMKTPFTHQFGRSCGKSVCFFVVWSFLLFGLFGCYFSCCLGGGVFFFCCLGGGPGPAQAAKNKTRPRPDSKKKKKHAPRPFRPCFFFFCLLFGRVGVFICLLFGPGACFFFAV